MCQFTNHYYYNNTMTVKNIIIKAEGKQQNNKLYVYTYIAYHIELAIIIIGNTFRRTAGYKSFLQHQK